MPTTDPGKLLDRILIEAADKRLDDAVFRRRTARAARQLQSMLGQPARSAATKRAGAAPTRRQSAARAVQPRYHYVTVPNGAGGTTSVSLSNAVFDELAQALGGAAKVTEHARSVAGSHEPGSGMTRTAYVLKRLRQRAARIRR